MKKDVTIIGIVGNKLYLSPLYAGDNYHESTISNIEKADLLEAGVEEYNSIDHIEAYCHNVSYEEYIQMIEKASSIENCNHSIGKLPF